ncbi:protein yippee-like At3g08990 [Capsella rubella]|uniref:protein yippee-like At3g08990 n=1 Tax=Capsella rubella TaxID=81985 RepID=UPI000CD49C36|nr:protein yippee-like At3g08990 [Capsella rubella]
MGRLFKIDLEGSVYKCKHCQVEFFVYDELPLKTIPFIEYPANLRKVYFFMKCFNVVIEPAKVTIIVDGKADNTMRPVFCIGCGSHLGSCYKGKDESDMYSEGNFFINRFKIHGPPDGSDNENP